MFRWKSIYQAKSQAILCQPNLRDMTFKARLKMFHSKFYCLDNMNDSPQFRSQISNRNKTTIHGLTTEFNVHDS